MHARFDVVMDDRPRGHNNAVTDVHAMDHAGAGTDMHTVAYTDFTLAQAVQTVTLNPARLLGLEARKGSIAPGKDADLVLLNEDLSVHSTMVAGEIVYRG